MLRQHSSLFLATLLVIILASITRAATTADDQPTTPTGAAVPELAALDRLMDETMRKYRFPGGALAVAKEGRLVFARGYGLADPRTGKAVEPDSLFRIASLSKPITSAVILKLVEAGKLDLDAKAIELIGNLTPPSGKQLDPRWRRITIRQLLHHTAGFDRAVSLDPMFACQTIAQELGVPMPPDPKAIVRFMLGRPLDFDPGTKFAYSNFGFCVLGRVIETLTGQSYEEAARSLVLSPAGITRMRVGRTRLSERLPGEVFYQAARRDSLGEPVFPDIKEKVAAPYGQFNLGAMDSHGGWVASAVDMLRFETAVDGSRQPCLLKPQSIRLLESPPAAPLPKDPHRYYGLGWSIIALDRGANWLHSGRLPGSSSMMVRLESGVCWVVLFNSDCTDAVYGEFDRGMHKALDALKTWPEKDQFARFP